MELDSRQLRYALLKIIPFKTIGVYASDQLIDVNRHNTDIAIIVNNQDSTLPGQHWLAFFKRKGENLEFFDSFANPIEFYGKEFVNFSKEKPLRQSNFQIQPDNTSTCGYFCLVFLYCRYRKMSFQYIVDKLFSVIDLEYNNFLVQQFVDSIHFPTFSDCENVCKKLCHTRGSKYKSICIQSSNKCLRMY